MSLTEIAYTRLLNQQIQQSQFVKPKDLVSYMGAMQAQDFNMVQWAVGLRLQNVKQQDVENAYNKGEILRTHLLRPTWHFVTSQDINWMLDLTAPRIKSICKSRWKELELTESDFNKFNKIIEKALSKEKGLTRNQLQVVFENAKINTTGNRMSHILLRAELDKIVCSGVNKGKTRTYALLRERIAKPKQIHREEALALLADRYFTSHGPATLEDFIWWSGLTVKDAKLALDIVETSFTSATIDSQTYWFKGSLSKPGKKMHVYLLPAYDEFLISYKNRSAALSIEPNNKVVSNNGIFYPVIIINGQVAGLWKRTIQKHNVIIETQLFKGPKKNEKRLIEQSVVNFSNFLGIQSEVRLKLYCD